jgi:hypothetical protein
MDEQFEAPRSIEVTESYLQREAEVDDEGVGQGLDVDPLAVVGELEAGDQWRSFKEKDGRASTIF